jgi:hypothetical protein
VNLFIRRVIRALLRAIKILECAPIQVATDMNAACAALSIIPMREQNNQPSALQPLFSPAAIN